MQARRRGHRLGAPEVLRLAERPDPAPAPDEVVVRIRAANVSPTDPGTRSGDVRGERREPARVDGGGLRVGATRPPR
jgi:NADPH:quinone reductase-like Zn-dependent oxidoreductase